MKVKIEVSEGITTFILTPESTFEETILASRPVGSVKVDLIKDSHPFQAYKEKLDMLKISFTPAKESMPAELFSNYVKGTIE